MCLIGDDPHEAHARSYKNKAIGRLCDKCDGKCVICDSLVRPSDLVRVCDECNFGTLLGKCVICGGKGISDAYYCKECVIQEKDVLLHWID
jgi:PHD finger-like domain-containing protein 5A